MKRLEGEDSIMPNNPEIIKGKFQEPRGDELYEQSTVNITPSIKSAQNPHIPVVQPRNFIVRILCNPMPRKQVQSLRRWH